MKWDRRKGGKGQGFIPALLFLLLSALSLNITDRNLYRISQSHSGQYRSDVRPWPWPWPEATNCRPWPWPSIWGLWLWPWPWPWPWGLWPLTLGLWPWPWPWGLGHDHILVIVKLLRTVAHVMAVIKVMDTQTTHYRVTIPILSILRSTISTACHFSSSGTCSRIVMQPHRAHMSNSLLETLMFVKWNSDL